MKESRRNFIGKSTAAAVAVGGLGMLSSCKEKPANTQNNNNKPEILVGACGISCSVCPLMKAGKCKGCGPANAVSAEMVSKKNCPVLNCASMKKIEYCGTDCPKFAECGKLVGHPYHQDFMGKIKAKLS